MCELGVARVAERNYWESTYGGGEVSLAKLHPDSRENAVIVLCGFG